MKLVTVFSVAMVFGLFQVRGQSQFDSVLIYNGFLRAGSTNTLLNAFKNPGAYKEAVDTTSKGMLEAGYLKSWNEMLRAAKKKKHFQMKVAGIRYAGEMTVEGKKHFYVLCGNTLLIDLTGRCNYLLRAEDTNTLENILEKGFGKQ